MSAHDEPGAAPLGRRQKFRMVMKVVELRLRFVALMAATGLGFAYWDTLWNRYEKWSRPAGPAVAAATDSEHYCPMHPSVVQPSAGSCPICGMPLSRRKKGEEAPLPAGVLSRVALSPDRVAQAGVRTVAAAYAPLAEAVTTVGTVEIDERRLRRIASKTKGMARVEKLHVDYTGVRVEAGRPLADVYSPELYQATQEMLLHHRNAQARPAGAARALGDPRELVRLAAERLKLWGITQGQVDEILKAGEAGTRLPILSPIDGVVIRKGVVEGEYVAEGQPLFEVADLTSVWVKARIYENQFALVREGQAVRATVEAYPGEVFEGRVAFVEPVLDPRTRTAVVRYDLSNGDLRLRPGMFAAVTLESPVADAPAFRARLASRPGAGRARTATLTVAEQEKCLVTNAKLGSMGDPLAVEVDGRRLWICCAGCESKIKATPAKYLARLEPAPRDAVLTIPESAVIDTGTRKVVYVEAEPGVFEGREVVLGPPSSGRYPVLEGLAPGEAVAAVGAFLVDAESRLNPAAAGGPRTPEKAAEAGAGAARR